MEKRTSLSACTHQRAVELVLQVDKWTDSEEVLLGKTKLQKLSNVRGGRIGEGHKIKKKEKGKN